MMLVGYMHMGFHSPIVTEQCPLAHIRICVRPPSATRAHAASRESCCRRHETVYGVHG